VGDTFATEEEEQDEIVEKPGHVDYSKGIEIQKEWIKNSA